MLQLDFFKSKEENEIDEMRRNLSQMHSSLDRIRKGLFARNGELVKQYMELVRRVEIIEKNICKS